MQEKCVLVFSSKINTASYASRLHQIMWTCGPPTIDSGTRSRSIEEQGASSVNG